MQYHSVAIPFSHGSLDDLMNDDSMSTSQSQESSSGSQQAATPSSSQSATQATAAVYEAEARLRINYRRLDADLKELRVDGGDLKRKVDAMGKELHEMQARANQIQAPNMKADERWAGV